MTGSAVAGEMNQPFRMVSIGRHSLVYGVGVLLGKVVAFILLPVYTRYLTPGDYGVLQLVVMTTEIVSIGAGTWLARGIFHFYHKADTEEERRAVISTALLILMGSFALGAMVMFFAAPALAELVFGTNGDHVLTLRLSGFALGVEGLFTVPVAYLRVGNRSVKFVTVQAVKLVLQVILNIVFIIPLGMGVNGVILSLLIATTLVGSWLTASLIRQNGISFSSGTARDLIRFGFPLFGVQIASFLLTFADGYFLSKAGDTAQVGIYRLAYQFGMLPITLAYVPFALMWDPARFAIARRPDRDQVYERVFIFLNVMIATMGVVVALFTTDFLRIVAAPAFHGASKIVPVLLIAYVIGSWSSYMNLGILIKERTGWMTVASWTAALVALVGYLVLIPRYLAWGAAITTVVSFMVRNVIVYVIAQRLWPIAYRWAPVWRLLGTAAIVSLAGIFAPPLSIAASLLYRLGLLVVYFCGVWFLKIIPEQDRAFLRLFARSPRAVLSAAGR